MQNWAETNEAQLTDLRTRLGNELDRIKAKPYNLAHSDTLYHYAAQIYVRENVRDHIRGAERVLRHSRLDALRVALDELEESLRPPGAQPSPWSLFWSRVQTESLTIVLELHLAIAAELTDNPSPTNTEE